jgi:3-phenylpropionate/trans-cinnamate dioxygenase ferredoxin subunit
VAFARAAEAGEVPEGGVVGVEVEGTLVCLVRVDGQVYAFHDKCSHRDFPLSNGELDTDACAITCEWHGAQFDVRTGEALCLPATRPVPTYPVEERDGKVWVDVG